MFSDTFRDSGHIKLHTKIIHYIYEVLQYQESKSIQVKFCLCVISVISESSNAVFVLLI